MTARALLIVSFLAACGAPAPPRPPQPPGARVHILPTDVVEDRFYVTPRLASGPKLRFFTDSGGGLFLAKAKATELGLPSTTEDLDGKPAEVVSLPAFADDASIPMPKSLPLYPGALPFDPPADGLLGQAWFADHVWSFDYVGKKLVVRDALPAHDPVHEVPLGFPGAAGKRETNFPRITVAIDGQPLDLLFDTGATVRLTPEALAALKDGRPASRATSFIVRSVFDAWHDKHPDWRVIENADANLGKMPMILVPLVHVGGFDVKDVWFTARPDPNFHDFMSSMMDKQVEGALGGSALRVFRVSVDYPNAVAVFEAP